MSEGVGVAQGRPDGERVRPLHVAFPFALSSSTIAWMRALVPFENQPSSHSGSKSRLFALTRSTTGDRSLPRALRVRARRSRAAVLRVAAKVARERTEAYRLAGRLSWVLGRHDRALAWWTKSLRTGESLGAAPELARTYAEVGERLGEASAARRVLGGLEDRKSVV